MLSMNFVSMCLNIVLSHSFSLSFKQVLYKKFQVFFNSVDVSASQQ